METEIKKILSRYQEENKEKSEEIHELYKKIGGLQSDNKILKEQLAELKTKQQNDDFFIEMCRKTYITA